MRSTMISLVAGTLLCTATYAGSTESSAPVANEAKPDATVTLKGGSVAAGIGYTWGRGEVTYGGTSRPFSVKGISIVDVGVTDYTAKGNVYKLKSISEFSGNYVAAGVGITLAGGGTAVYLKNEHGVVIKLISTDVGLKFKLSADGVHVALTD
jgi:hypothetical protein